MLGSVSNSRSSLVALALITTCYGCGGSSEDGNDEVGETATDTTTSESGTETSTASETETSTDTTETGEPPVEHYEVGFDVHDLSPSDAELTDEFYLGGYGAPYQRGVALGVHDPVFVRSMAIGYGPNDGVVLAIVDAIGIGNQIQREIRASAAANLGLDESRIIVAATHSHSAPDLQGLWGGVPDDYKARLIADIVESLGVAWNGKIPATLEVASTTSSNRNRRDWGFTDDALFALHATSLEGDPLGLMVTFAAHPVILGDENLMISRDYCGYTVDKLEDELGVPVLFFNGIQGDVSPDGADGMFADDFERADFYGDLVAQSTLDVLDQREPVGVDFYHEQRPYELDVENELFKLVAQAGIIYYDFTVRGDMFWIDTQATYMRFGEEIQMIAFPGESLTRNGLPVKDMMTAPHKVVLGLATDSLGYFVPSDEWMTGHNDNYEESVSVGMAAGDITRDLLFDMIAADPWDQ
ncbi:hypothetical protein ACNOYE_20600 [Nannocystaceae bacterium ST9]